MVWYIGSYHTGWSTPYLLALASAAGVYLLAAFIWPNRGMVADAVGEAP